MTVVHFFGVLDRGGAETVALDLCRAVPPDEFQQVFLTLSGREGRLAGEFRAAGAQVQPFPLRPLGTFVPRLLHRLRRLRPDVVVSHVSLVSGLVLAVAAAAGVPTRIAHLHSDGDGRPDTGRRRAQRTVLRALLRHCATDVVGVTAAATAFAAPRDHDPRFRVLPNGIDIDRFARTRRRRDRNGRPVVLTHVGRAAPEKNRAFLLRVHAEARRLRDGTELRFVGPGGTADLAAADPAFATNPAVHATGETDAIEEVFASCDVLLLPSRREGLPGVVLQALAAGVPVLASDLPGVREIAAEVHGVTILPLDAGPQAWARTALRLADLSLSERDAISDGMRRSHFALDRYAQEWRRLWAPRS